MHPIKIRLSLSRLQISLLFYTYVILFKKTFLLNALGYGNVCLCECSFSHDYSSDGTIRAIHDIKGCSSCNSDLCKTHFSNFCNNHPVKSFCLDRLSLTPRLITASTLIFSGILLLIAYLNRFQFFQRIKLRLSILMKKLIQTNNYYTVRLGLSDEASQFNEGYYQHMNNTKI